MSEIRIPIRAVAALVAEVYGIPLNLMRGQSKLARIVRPRQIAMHLCVRQLGKSLPEIGRFFGGRDHTTVLHGDRVISALVAEDASLAAKIDGLKRQIQAMETEASRPPAEPLPLAADVPPPPPEVVIAAPPRVSALTDAVGEFLKARKRLEDDTFSPHEAPSRREEARALTRLRAAFQQCTAEGATA